MLVMLWPQQRGGGRAALVQKLQTAAPRRAASAAAGLTTAAAPVVSPQRRGWAREIANHSRKVYSQRGQDGVLEWIFQNVGTTNKFFVEFGYNSKHLYGGSGPNTALLRRNGWRGVLLDGENKNEAVGLYAHFLCPSNIAAVFELRGVPAAPDYVSIDVDGYDPWLMRELMRDAKFAPRVISVEFNAAFPRDSNMTIAGWGACESDNSSYVMTRLNSASPGVIARMGDEAGYALVHLEGDAFLVRRDQLGDDPWPLEKLPAALPNDAGCFDAEWEGRIKKGMGRWLWDYGAWLRTASAGAAAAAARAMVADAERRCGFKIADDDAWDE